MGLALMLYRLRAGAYMHGCTLVAWQLVRCGVAKLKSVACLREQRQK